MTWDFEIPGQPLSWNGAYRIGLQHRPGGRGTFRTIIKTDAAVAYCTAVAMLAAVAKPSGWKPSGLVVIEYRLFLGRNVDCDNVMKLIGDGIQDGTGVGDEWFLPRAIEKTWGLRPDQRKVLISVFDAESPSLGVPR